MSRGYVSLSTLAYWAGGLYISSVDFGCFSTVYRDCEALDEREKQVTFTLLFVCILYNLKILDYEKQRKRDYQSSNCIARKNG